MKAFRIVVDRAERYIVLSGTVEGAMGKAIEKRKKEYPGSSPSVTELTELSETVLR